MPRSKVPVMLPCPDSGWRDQPVTKDPCERCHGWGITVSNIKYYTCIVCKGTGHG